MGGQMVIEASSDFMNLNILMHTPPYFRHRIWIDLAESCKNMVFSTPWPKKFWKYGDHKWSRVGHGCGMGGSWGNLTQNPNVSYGSIGLLRGLPKACRAYTSYITHLQRSYGCLLGLVWWYGRNN